MVKAAKANVCPKPTASYWRPWENPNSDAEEGRRLPAGNFRSNDLSPKSKSPEKIDLDDISEISKGSSTPHGYIDSDDFKPLHIDTASEGVRERRFSDLSAISKSSNTPHGYIDSDDFKPLHIDTASEGERERRANNFSPKSTGSLQYQYLDANELDSLIAQAVNDTASERGNDLSPISKSSEGEKMQVDSDNDKTLVDEEKTLVEENLVDLENLMSSPRRVSPVMMSTPVKGTQRREAGQTPGVRRALFSQERRRQDRERQRSYKEFFKNANTSGGAKKYFAAKWQNEEAARREKDAGPYLVNRSMRQAKDKTPQQIRQEYIERVRNESAKKNFDGLRGWLSEEKRGNRGTPKNQTVIKRKVERPSRLSGVKKQSFAQGRRREDRERRQTTKTALKKINNKDLWAQHNAEKSRGEPSFVLRPSPNTRQVRRQRIQEKVKQANKDLSRASPKKSYTRDRSTPKKPYSRNQSTPKKTYARNESTPKTSYAKNVSTVHKKLAVEAQDERSRRIAARSNEQGPSKRQSYNKPEKKVSFSTESLVFKDAYPTNIADLTRVDKVDNIDWEKSFQKNEKSFREKAKSFLRQKGVMPKVGKSEIELRNRLECEQVYQERKELEKLYEIHMPQELKELGDKYSEAKQAYQQQAKDDFVKSEEAEKRLQELNEKLEKDNVEHYYVVKHNFKNPNYEHNLSEAEQRIAATESEIAFVEAESVMQLKEREALASQQREKLRVLEQSFKHHQAEYENSIVGIADTIRDLTGSFRVSDPNLTNSSFVSGITYGSLVHSFRTPDNSELRDNSLKSFQSVKTGSSFQSGKTYGSLNHSFRTAASGNNSRNSQKSFQSVKTGSSFQSGKTYGSLNHSFRTAASGNNSRNSQKSFQSVKTGSSFQSGKTYGSLNHSFRTAASGNKSSATLKSGSSFRSNKTYGGLDRSFKDVDSGNKVFGGLDESFRSTRSYGNVRPRHSFFSKSTGYLDSYLQKYHAETDKTNKEIRLEAAEEERLCYMTKIQETKIDLNQTVLKLDEIQIKWPEDIEIEKLTLQSKEKDLENAIALLDMSYTNYEKKVQNQTNTSKDLQRCKDLEKTMMYCQREVEQLKSDIAENNAYRVEKEKELISEAESLKKANDAEIEKLKEFETKQLLGVHRSTWDYEGREYTLFMDDDHNPEMKVWTAPPLKVGGFAANYSDDPEEREDAVDKARDGDYDVPESDYTGGGMFGSSDDGPSDECRKAASDECFKDVGWSDDATTCYPGSANTSWNSRW